MIYSLFGLRKATTYNTLVQVINGYFLLLLDVII